jgi:hypothetical protein
LDELLNIIDENNKSNISEMKLSREQREADSILQEMQRGIRVTKYHYTQMKFKECRLHLSHDMRKLIWFYDD